MSSIMHLATTIDSVKQLSLSANHRVFSQGQMSQHYIYVQSGSIKVLRHAGNGREFVLYRIKPHEMCVLTTACMLGNFAYPADAVTETETEALLFGQADFDQLTTSSAEFRNFVLANFGQRLTDLMKQLEHVTLKNIDQRLAEYLLRMTDKSGQIKTTHQFIATDIGTAREVISRHLKAIEKKGIIKLGRGTIQIINKKYLLDLI